MKTVVGLFDTAEEAREAVNELESSGVNSENIDISYNADTDISDDNYADKHKETGSAVGNFFRHLFGEDDDQADRYSRVANKAGCIVTVHADSDEEAQNAADVLDDYGAMDMDDRAAQYDYNNSDNTDKSSDTLNVIKEDVQIGKKEVETGGVRLRSRIIERPVEENLRLRQEKVTVERTPVDRVATDADLSNFKEGEIEMTETTEVADINKQARVVEEVKLSKDVNHEDKTVKETARDTEVDVEDLRKGNNKNDY